jgi:hypothetical protein
VSRPDFGRPETEEAPGGARHDERALLAGDPSKPGVYVMMSK